MQIPPGFGQTLQPRGNVHPVPIDPLALDHHVAQVDADAKLHPALRQANRRFRSLNVLLDLDGALHGIHDAGKLGQQVIARESTLGRDAAE